MKGLLSLDSLKMKMKIKISAACVACLFSGLLMSGGMQSVSGSEPANRYRRETHTGRFLWRSFVSFRCSSERRLCRAEAGRRVKISVQVKISPADFFFLSIYCYLY